MKRKNWRAIINHEYNLIARICESSSNADRLLERAFVAARDGERRHRRGTGRPRCLLGAEDTARWFVLKWIAERRTGKRKRLTALEFASLREDTALGYAVRDWLDSQQRYPFTSPPESTNLEYSGGIVSR